MTDRTRATRWSGTDAAVSPFGGAVADRLRFFALLIFLALCALGGGTSFPDALSLLYLRPAALLLILTCLLLRPGALAEVRMPLLLLAAFAGIIMVQLVPLPPELWTSLPGRSHFAEAAQAAGLAQPWRPISLTPDLTWNSLVSLIVPAAVLAGFASIRPDQREALVPVLLILLLASMALGIAQFATGRDSPLYFYRRVHEGLPIGFLANRNHQAALLAIGFPALSLWVSRGPPERWRARVGAALGASLLLIATILASGSRAGLACAAVGLMMAALIMRKGHGAVAAIAQLRRLWAGLFLLTALLAGAVYMFGRGYAFERLAEGPAAIEDLRFQYYPVTIEITERMFPFGSGFGSFDPVYRAFEPHDQLKLTYVNHAHNDLLELAMTGGLPALIILVAFLVWWLAKARTLGSRNPATAYGALGFAIVLILLTASIVDYPLRTPLLGAVFALGCGWLATLSGGAGRSGNHAQTSQG